jgi:IS605 OrfB family transposase
MLRLYSGKSWQWIKLHLKGDPLPEGWQANSPVIIRRGRSFRLHTPLEKQIKKPEKAIDQVAHNPALRVCSIDLNLGDAQAVCTIVQANGTEVATRFIRGGKKLHARRRRLLGKVAVNRSKTGVLAEDEQDNKKVWNRIRAIEDNEAHRISRRIVEFALAHDATILVFEHLKNLKPQKGRYSKRSNEKRAYWLKGRIVKYARYKGWEHGLLTCMVSPAYTSQNCSKCGQRPVARYAEGQAPIDYHPGAPLFICFHCFKRGHADRNASVNVGLRFFHGSFATIATHLSQKPFSKDEGVQLAQGAAGLGGLNGPALPTVSLAQLRLNGSGHAAGTGERVYAGVP